MYQEILQVIAILAIVGLGLYPILFKKNKSWKWHFKGCLSIGVIYAICLFITLSMGLK